MPGPSVAAGDRKPAGVFWADFASGMDRERGRTIERAGFDGRRRLMAWVDDRIWCHPKFTDVSDRAFRAHVNAIAYSTGFGTRGVLTPGQQRTIGSDARSRRELVAAELWDDLEDGSVAIHNWDEHNGKRDARRAADRERKKVARSNGASAGQSAGRSTLPARAEGSEGSDGSERTKAVTARGRPPAEADSLRLVVKAMP